MDIQEFCKKAWGRIRRFLTGRSRLSMQQFCEIVCDPEKMYKYPAFLSGFVVPNRIAFKQYDMEVLRIKTYTHDEWVSNAFILSQGWPQSVKQGYDIFIKEYYHE